MQYDIYKVKNSNGHANKDTLTESIEHLGNTMFEDSDSYAIHSVVPVVEDGEVSDVIVTLEKHYDRFVEVNFYNVDSNELIYEYKRTEVGDLLATIKASNVIEVKTKDKEYKLKYINNNFRIIDGLDYVEEGLHLYFKVIE